MKPRIIPLALIKNGSLIVTSQKFKPWRTFGTLPQFLKLQVSRQADELIILDIEATKESRIIQKRVFNQCTDIANIPLTLGGGIHSCKDVLEYIQSGADKIVITSWFLDDRSCIPRVASLIGAQSLCLKIDYMKEESSGKYHVYDYRSQKMLESTLSDVLVEIKDCPIGELMLCSVDRDGSLLGLDIAVLDIIPDLNMPLILCGGAVSEVGFVDALSKHNVNAVAGGSVFDYTSVTPLTIKRAMVENGLKARRS